MSKLSKALNASGSVAPRRTRQLGALLENFRQQDFYINSVVYKNCRVNGKKKITVYIVDGDQQQRFWISQRDIARIFSSDIKRIQGLVASKGAIGMLTVDDKRRLGGRTQEALLSVRTWRKILFSYKLFAKVGGIMRAAFDALLTDLDKCFPPITTPKKDSTVHQGIEASVKTRGKWTPAPAKETGKPIARNVVMSLKATSVTPKADEPAEKAAPAPEAPACGVPTISVYKIMSMKMTQAQLLHTLRRVYPAIGESATICKTEGDGIQLEWEESE